MFLTSTVSQSIRKTVTGTRYSKHGVVSKADAPLPPRTKTVGFQGDFDDTEAESSSMVRPASCTLPSEINWMTLNASRISVVARSFFAISEVLLLKTAFW